MAIDTSFSPGNVPNEESGEPKLKLDLVLPADNRSNPRFISVDAPNTFPIPSASSALVAPPAVAGL